MDRVFLINIHRIFVIIRSNINNNENIKLLSLVKNNFDRGGLNATFLNDIYSLQLMLKNPILDYLSNEISTSIDFDQRFNRIFIFVLTKTIQLLQENATEQAYDLIDAFHVLPELVADEIKVDYADFYNIYVKPLSSRWGTSFTGELYNLLLTDNNGDGSPNS